MTLIYVQTPRGAPAGQDAQQRASYSREGSALYSHSTQESRVKLRSPSRESDTHHRQGNCERLWCCTMTNTHDIDPEANAETVTSKWFQDNVRSKFEDSKGFRPDSLQSKLKEFPGAFKAYRIQDGPSEPQGIWVRLGTDAELIKVMEMPSGRAKVLLCHKPLEPAVEKKHSPRPANSAPDNPSPSLWTFYNPLIRQRSS